MIRYSIREKAHQIIEIVEGAAHDHDHVPIGELAASISTLADVLKAAGG